MWAMNSRWFLAQGSTLKRVAMENEREKSLREELKKIQDSKPKGDSLLKLIRSLQRLQASGPPALGVRSPFRERSEVARAVEKYLTSTGSASGTEASNTGSSDKQVVRSSGKLQIDSSIPYLRVLCQWDLLRCKHCHQVLPARLFPTHAEGVTCRDAKSEQVFFLSPTQL